jgi:phosphoribosylformimino-5-aminoimidazole carboxamide ribonucleotide (ProFAR) isomerase
MLTHSSLPIQAAGGVGSMDDLRTLEKTGVAAVVLGMGLYTGALDPNLLLEEFAQ